MEKEELQEVRVTLDVYFRRAQAVLEIMKTEVYESNNPCMGIHATPYKAGKNSGYNISNCCGRELNLTINNVDGGIMLFMGAATDFCFSSGQVKPDAPVEKFYPSSVEQASTWIMDYLVYGKYPA